MHAPLYMVKIGGSIITDTQKPSTARGDQIERLIAEIAAAKKERSFALILGHGGGSFGHMAAKKYRVNEGLINPDSIKGTIQVHTAMQQLNTLVIQAAEAAGLSPYPFIPSSFACSSSGRIEVGTAEGIKSALESGFTPVVYGDSMFDTKQGVSIVSTEEVFRFIATKIRPDKIILGADIDGTYDKNPNENSDARLVKQIDSSNISSVLEGSGGAKKVDVTGGMKSKLTILYEMVKSTGAQGYIANAGKAGVIESILMGREVNCTTVRA